jgi:hypothetical protein
MSKLEKQPINSIQEDSQRFREKLIQSHNGNEKVGEKYDELIENLREHGGQLLLVETIKKRRKTDSPLSQEKPENFDWIKEIQLGVIRGEPKIDLKFGRIFLTDESLSFEIENLSPRPDEESEIKNLKRDKSVSLYWHDIPKIDTLLKKIDPMAPNIPVFKIKIFFGEEANKRFQNYPFNFDQVEDIPQNVLNCFIKVKT